MEAGPGRMAHLDEGGSETVCAADGVHVPLEIHVEELEYEVQLGIRVDNVKQPGANTINHNRSAGCQLELTPPFSLPV